MEASKKCPTCGHWSKWNQKPQDLCQHCQNPIDPQALARIQLQKDRMEEEKKQFTVDFIQINPEDSPFTKFYKRIGLAFQLAFVGIVSFIIWFLTLLAG
ncbi:MAG: hypothetical protein ACO1OQ_05660 [Rufibacter sp.]